jgi:hypothetical protein
VLTTEERTSEVIEGYQVSSLQAEDLNQINPLDTHAVYFGVTETGACVHAGMVDDGLVQKGWKAFIVAFCSASVLIQEPSTDFPIERSKRLCANCFRRTTYSIAERIRTFVRDGKTVEVELAQLISQADAGMGKAQMTNVLREIVERERARTQNLLSFEKGKDRPFPASDKLIDKISQV